MAEALPMSAVFQPPPLGSIAIPPPPGGIKGKPPGGFVYPYWLPQIPGTIEVARKEPPHGCPTEVPPKRATSQYYGSVYDESISNRLIVGKSLRDCEVTFCHLEDCDLVDCLVVGSNVCRGSATDVELRGCVVFSTKVHDVKASAECKFGQCTITEGDLTDSSIHNSDVKSSEVKRCKAWEARFDGTTLKEVTAYKGCTFSDCGGDVPKVAAAASSSSSAATAAPYDGALPTAPDCPAQPFSEPTHLSRYTGALTDEKIERRAIIGKTLTDCEVRDCYIADATINDCLVVNCQINKGFFKDVELRACQLFMASVDDVKALEKCKFGQCTVHEGDLQNCHFDRCTVASSEATNGIAWDTKFRDVTLNKVSTVGKCKFALCGGDVPKKDDESDSDGDERGARGVPAPYTGGAGVGVGSSGSPTAAAPSGLALAGVLSSASQQPVVGGGLGPANMGNSASGAGAYVADPSSATGSGYHYQYAGSPSSTGNRELPQQQQATVVAPSGNSYVLPTYNSDVL